jgi:Tol biopolymer transport system component
MKRMPKAAIRVAMAVALVAMALLSMAQGNGPVVTQAADPLPGCMGISSDRDGNYNLYILRLSDLGMNRLTDNPASDFRPSISPDGLKVAFQSQRDGHSEIYVMNSNGTGSQTRLTFNDSSTSAWHPVWKSDGTKIAFNSDKSGGHDIWVMNPDGSGQTALPGTGAWEGDPWWSPDGAQIVFASERDGGTEVYKMNGDGSAQTRLTFSASDDRYPSWSPDGTRIAFHSDRDGNQNIYVLNIATSALTRITDNPASDAVPVWSPDSTKIAFSSNRDGKYDVFVVNAADGSGLQKVTASATAFPGNNSVQHWGGCPSSMTPPPPPTGCITFAANRDGKYDIYVAPADRSAPPTKITNDPTMAFQPTWSPDGTKIAYFTTQYGNNDIMVMDEYGNNQTRLTSNSVNDHYAKWSPDGTKIVFTTWRWGAQGDIGVMSSTIGDAGVVTRLTDYYGEDYGPHWSVGDSESPEGWIVFERGRNTSPNNWDIYKIKATGPVGSEVLLTTHPADDDYPAWSPDGKQIVWDSRRGTYNPSNPVHTGTPNLWLMDKDGNNQRAIPNLSGVNSHPAWSPDGKLIAFLHSEVTDQADIYVTDPAGTTMIRITDMPGVEQFPSWKAGACKAIVPPAPGTNLTLTLLDAEGRGLAGGTAVPAVGGTWKPQIPGATDANGKLLLNVDYTGITKIKMTVNQSSQEKTMAELAANNYTWQTSKATINVKHWDGTPFAGVSIDQGGGFWDVNKATTDATGTATVPMFTGATGKFKANYNFTSQTITQSIATPFVFQTGRVHSDSSTCTRWATGSWNTFTQDMEVFPGSYRFVFSDGTPTTEYPIAVGVVNHIH